MRKILEILIAYLIIMTISYLTYKFTSFGSTQALIGIGLSLGLVYLLDK
jgi:hypothetical protein